MLRKKRRKRVSTNDGGECCRDEKMLKLNLKQIRYKEKQARYSFKKSVITL